MKIVSLEAIALEKDPGCLSRPVLCRINTSEGNSGLGEAAVAIGTGAPAAFEQIRDLAPLILGMDPRDHELIWEKMFRRSFWAQGSGAIVMAAISAVDIALWDIKAKAANLPLYKLLGGKQREKLRSYASQLQFDWGWINSCPLREPPGTPRFTVTRFGRRWSRATTRSKPVLCGLTKTEIFCPISLPPAISAGT
jgi:L-alanine-DL-glutamate epimerase-like enolase superfamily enzyme